MKNTFTSASALFLTALFLGCAPASVSYIDPAKTTPTQKLSESSCTIKRISDAEVQLSCPDGSSQIIKDGVNGSDGSNGANGKDGSDGKNGADGKDGANGADGKDAKSVEIIDPCGKESKIGFDEILLRMPDRSIIAYLRIDTYEHLARLPSGFAYLTTDDTQCEFKIDSDGTVYDSRGGVF